MDRKTRIEDGERLAAPLGSVFVVQDLTGELPPRPCNSQDSASKWSAHLMEWRPNVRTAVDPDEKLIIEALNAGMACAEECKLNSTYHKRVLSAAMSRSRPKV